MRLIGWNIRAGGGVRAAAIASQIVDWQADIVALSEFRATPPSVSIAAQLCAAGLHHQRTTANPKTPAINALLVASRWPLRRVSLRRAPNHLYRWLHVSVATPTALAIMAMHIPNRVSGLKYPFMQAVEDVVSHWHGPPAVLLGDTNSGKIEIDEESPAFNKIEHRWLERMEQRRWADAFRQCHGDAREFTWYSPNGKSGFRLDQAFVHPNLARRPMDFQHVWAGANASRREVLSDHAAMVIDLLA